VSRDPRSGALAAQIAHAREASGNREQFAAAGRARPATLAAQSPLSTGYRAPATRPPAFRDASRSASYNANACAFTTESAAGSGNRSPGDAPEQSASPTVPESAGGSAASRGSSAGSRGGRPWHNLKFRASNRPNRPAPEARPSFREARPGPPWLGAAPEARPQPRAAAPPPRPARQARPEAQPARRVQRPRLEPRPPARPVPSGA